MKNNPEQETIPGRRPKASGARPGRKYTKCVWAYLTEQEFDDLETAAKIVGENTALSSRRSCNVCRPSDLERKIKTY